MRGILRFLFLTVLVVLLSPILVGQAVSPSKFTTVYPKFEQILEGNINLEWNNKINASFYRVQIGSDASFTTLVVDSSNILTNQLNLNLTVSQSYYWRVLSTDRFNAMDTSNISTFSVFSPKSLDSLELWLIGDSVNLTALNRVSSWYDLSDPTNVLNQSNSARQPDFVPNYINGYGVVDFLDIRPSVFTSIANVTTRNYYVSSVYNWHGVTGLPTKFINSQTAGNFWNLAPDNIHSLTQQGGQVGTGAPIVQDRFVLNTAYAFGDSVTNIINGVEYGKALTTFAPQALRISIGNNLKMNGAVAEIIVYAGTLSKTEQERVDHYLMDKYAPPINLGSDRIVCNLPDSIELINDYIVNYSWNTGETTPKIRFDTAGLYILNATDIFGRTFTDSILIFQDTVDYKVSFNEDTLNLCKGQQALLNSNLNDSRFSYLWNNGITEPEIQVTSTGLYKLAVNNCKGNTSVDSVFVQFNEPKFSLGNDTIGCFNTVLSLTSDSSFTNVSYQWSTNQTSPTINADSSNLYVLTVTDQYGCTYSDSINVSIDSSLMGVSLGPDTTLCKGSSLSLKNSASSITSYLWSTGNNLPDQIIDTTGTYVLTVSNASCLVSDTINVIIKGEAPSVGFTNTSLCLNAQVLFTDTTIDPNGITLTSFRWNFGDGSTSTLRNPSHTFDSLKLYEINLEVENDSGCVASTSKFLQINDTPTSNFQVGISCEQDSTQFINASVANAGMINSTFWDFGFNNSSSTSFNPSFTYNSDSIYSVTLIVETDLGCRDTVEKLVKVNSKPTALFSYTNNVLGDTVRFTNLSRIDSGLIASNAWNFGNGNNSILNNPIQAYNTFGKYNVTLNVVSDSGCTSTFEDSIEIRLPEPEFNTVFPRQNQTLAIANRFVWNLKEGATTYEVQFALDKFFTNIIYAESGIRTTHLSYSISASDDYFWRVIAVSNSINIDTTNIGLFSVFSPLEIDSLTLWLNGESVAVDANNKVSSWFDLSDSSRILVQTGNNRPTLLTNYINHKSALDFEISSGSNFFPSAADINNSRFYISSVYNFHEATGRFCSFINSSLLGNRWILGPYFKHRIFDQNNFVGDGADIVQDRFVVNTALGTGDSISNIINGNLIGTELLLNKPRNLRIGINNNERMNGAVAEIIMIDGTVSKQQQMKIDNYLMDKYSPPINLGRDRIVCSFPDSIILENDYIVKYDWNTGDTTASIEVDSAGLYYVETVDIFGRTSTDSVFFSEDTTNYQIAFFEDTLNKCLGEIVELSGETNRFSYLWSTGETIPTIRIDTTDLYVLSVTNCLGNTFKDSIQVIFNQPKFSLGNDTTRGCFNTVTSLFPNVGFTNVSYLWSNGPVTDTIIADVSGLYSLQIEDQFGCTYSDTTYVLKDSSLIPFSLGNDTTVCRGNSISLINDSPTIKSYLWSTGNASSVQIVDTAGIYTLTYSNNTCTTSDTIVLTIKGDAPTAKFSTSNLCFGDSVSFIDSSFAVTGDTIKQWSWSFGDGNLDSIQNPKNQYLIRQTYSVLLEVETDKGCSDTISSLVKIDPLPKANFNFQNIVPCSKKPIFHEDSSFVSLGSIVAYQWNFGDPTSAQNTSNFSNPFHSYDTLGAYIVSLAVETDKGCKDTVQKIINVNPTPNVKYSYLGNCLSDSIRFLNQTILPSGSVFDFKWDIFRMGSQDFIGLTSENPIIKFIESGSYTTQLRVRTNINGTPQCEAIKRDTIQVFETPIANFSVPVICEDVPFTVTNLSSSIDSISSYRFIYNNEDTLLQKDIVLLENTAGSYELKLNLETENGCVDSVSQTIVVNGKPTPAFNILNNNTGIPFNIVLENSSQNASNYVWSFGNGDTDNSKVPVYTYSDTGTFQLQLKAISAKGCEDSLTKEVYSLVEFLDAELSDIFLTENALGDITVSARILNTGFNTINQINLVVDLNNEFEFRESFNSTIYSLKSNGFTFGSSFISDAGRKIDFVCVRIQSVNGVQDSISTNNELCEKGYSNVIRLDLYPNPVEDNLTVQYSLPDDGEVKLEIFDALGRRLNFGYQVFQQEGYYSTLLRMGDLDRGIYYYRFTFNASETTGKFMKR